ncbi:MAG: hypothetical protein ACTHJT_13610 [Cytophaga sp.]|uniref:hypothetical protein n=1 Tax=Cytophaga sp. TaxID=29535 RepID=UPI003F7E2AD7
MIPNTITKDYEIFIIDNIIRFYTNHNLKFRHKTNCSDYISQYFNFRLRYIGFNSPYEVFISNELQNKIQSHPDKQCIDNIISKLKNGEDVNQHQSIQLSNTEYDDDLFNDWGLHHLHLSEEPNLTHPNYYKRTEDLLFIRFIDNKAYLIDILPHNNFHRKSLIAVIQNNWDYILQEAYNTWYPDFSEDEIKIMRKKGYLIGVNINGKGYMMLGHGYFSSGINMMAGSMSDEVLIWIGKNMHLKGQNLPLFQKGILAQLYM